MKKRRSKGGRPRKVGVERFPGGQITPAATIKETRSVVVCARMRHHQISEERAVSILAGSVLGRLLMSKRITEQQHEAGQAYAEVVATYYRATGYPSQSAKAQDVLRVRGREGDPDDDSDTRITNAGKRMRSRNAILHALPNGISVRQTVFAVCVLDQELGPGDLARLKRGLDAL